MPSEARPIVRARTIQTPDEASTTKVGTSMPTWVTIGLVVAIAAGIALRLIWPGDIEYKADEQYTFARVQEVLAGGPWPSVGMMTSMGTFNPGMSVWIFIALGGLFGARSAPELATDVQLLNAAGIIGLIVFARFAIPVARREIWYWAAALWALNPVAIILERKIWPPSVLPAFAVLLIACWWYRHRSFQAFAWGALGAAMGQVHASAWFLALMLLVWTLLYDRHSPKWLAWFAGNVVSALFALPWLVETLHRQGQPAWNMHAVLKFFYYAHYELQPFGFYIDYTLGPHEMSAFLGGPEIAGYQTHLMAVLQGVMALLVFAVGILVVRRLRKTTWPKITWQEINWPKINWQEISLQEISWPSWRDVFVGRDNETLLMLAVFWGYYGLLTLIIVFGAGPYVHYMIVTTPVMTLWLAHWTFSPDIARLSRAILVAICITLASAGAGLLGYIHVKQVIAGEYGPTWRSQQPLQSR